VHKRLAVEWQVWSEVVEYLRDERGIHHAVQ